MCLLIYKPETATIPFEHLKIGSRSNPHGAGVAIADGNRLIIQKNAKWGEDDIQELLEKYKGHPAIVHFRYATHGSKNYANTHPFWLNDKWCAAHNGVISSIKTRPDESDTRAFLRIHVKPFLAEKCQLDDKDIINLLGEEMGSWNKMVYLSANGEVGIANESSGHWNNGIWYSNHNYEDYACYSDYGSCGRNYGSRHFYTPKLPYRAGTSTAPSSYTPTVQYDHPTEDEIAEAMANAADDGDNAEENFHRLNTYNITCDICNKKVHGDFKLGGETGMIVCETCEFFGKDDQGIN